MDKFFIAVANNSSGKGLSSGSSSGKCKTREDAEIWARDQIQKGRQNEFIIMEALSVVKCDISVTHEELKQSLLPAPEAPENFSEAAE